jgi:VCBS repeat-containing protein
LDNETHRIDRVRLGPIYGIDVGTRGTYYFDAFDSRKISYNNAPSAVGDSFVTNEDTALVIAAPGVLSNDSDAEMEALSSVFVTGPAHGTLTMSSDGAFSYTPAANYNGGDSFTYRASDGKAYSNVATVTITVNPVNDAPLAAGDSYTAFINQVLSIAAPGVLANDSDVDGPALTAGLVSSPTHGTLSLNPNGSFSYTPNAGYSGDDSFTYQASDSLTSSTAATVSIQVTDLIFADGFESGSLSAWSASQTDGGNLSASPAAAMVGSYGLQVVINDNNTMFVTDDRPAAESGYKASFYFDPNSISMANGNAQDIFYVYRGSTPVVMWLEFRYYSGSYQLRGWVREDNGVGKSSSWFNISDDRHQIEMYWMASTGVGANNGYMRLWVDGVQKAELTGLDNETHRIDRVRLGPIYGIDVGTRGTYYFDAFDSRKISYTGP